MMVYCEWKDCINYRINLDLRNTCEDMLKETIDLAKESDHISYALADINCSLCVKLSNASIDTVDDLNKL